MFKCCSRLVKSYPQEEYWKENQNAIQANYYLSRSYRHVSSSNVVADGPSEPG